MAPVSPVPTANRARLTASQPACRGHAGASSSSSCPPAAALVPGVSSSRRDLRESRMPALEMEEAESASAGLRLAGQDEQEGPSATGDRLRRAPTWAIIVNNVAFMAVPRSIPACFAATGWRIGLAALAYSSVVTYDTGMVLGEVHSLRPSLSSYPALCGEAFAHRAARRGASRHVADWWRTVAARTCLCVQFATYYLTTVAELIYFEQFFGQVFDDSPLCQWQWLLVAAVVSIPLLQLPTFHETRWAALVVGVMPLVLNVSVMFYEVALVRPWDCTPGPSYDGGGERDAAGIFLGLSAFSYAFGGHGFYPEEMREMRTPSKWPTVMHWTYGLVLPLYWACGVLGYYAYGDYSLANINLNFPKNKANLLSIAVQLVQEIYFIVSTNLVLNLSMELALGIDPVACCAPAAAPAPGRTTAATADLSRDLSYPVSVPGTVDPHVGLGGKGGGEAGSGNGEETGLRVAAAGGAAVVGGGAAGGWRVAPWLQRMLLRTAFFASQVLVAQTLLSGEGDTLIAIQSLIGAVGMTAFTYFMPYILLILLTPTPLSRLRLCWFYFNIGMGVLVMFGGLASSMDDLISSSTGIFAGTCTLSFAYSPTSPDDPCFDSGLPANVSGQT